MRLHPFFHIITEQRRNVEQNHKRTCDGQRQNGCLRGAGLNDGDGLICSGEMGESGTKNEREDEVWKGGEGVKEREIERK